MMTDEARAESWRWDRGDGGVWTLWFDQPGRKLNVLGRAALEELDERLAEVEADDSVQGILIRGAKPTGFCAGADLHLLGEASAEEVEAYIRRGLDVLDRLMRLGPATVAVLHGACMGGGFDLALACRHRVGLATSVPLQLGSPEVRFGLIPGWGAIEQLPRLIEPKNALDLLLDGDPIGFLQAHSQGVVGRLVSADESDRLLEVLTAEAPVERPFLAEDWQDELAFARAKMERAHKDFPEAHAAILRILEIDLSEGPEAAREATVASQVELATSPATRAAIVDFFHRENRR